MASTIPNSRLPSSRPCFMQPPAKDHVWAAPSLWNPSSRCGKTAMQVERGGGDASVPWGVRAAYSAFRVGASRKVTVNIYSSGEMLASRSSYPT